MLSSFLLIAVFAVFSRNNDTNVVMQTKYVNANNIGITTDSSLNGTWYLIPVLASDTAAGKFPFLTINLKKKQFTGNDGCNDISGTFVAAEDKLTFSDNIKGTKMECKGYDEKAFLHNFLLTSNYKIEDGILSLMNGKTVISKWSRKRAGGVVKETM
ncbi:META domain-containing protein [Pinibacter aurantiacus]|uniref:META domain-containing protein n=1 Tax=Pinibacter aurantiacus TaxID=2851599 RepID=A0A9E2SC56_9BACT|nr:META domain-containing protein [Pinibacter aurantiacus]MBV4359442.1 META domain-containing protein [Pinibacter aurantiacus]